MLRLRLRGPFEAQREDGTPLELPTRKTEQLLAYLWIHRGQPQPRERLAGLFWPESPESKARLSLRQALSSLRKTLEPTEDLKGRFLLLRRDVVQFLPEAPCWIDVEEFKRDLAEAQQEDLPAEERLRLLQEAVSLYRGDFLEGCYDDWCLAEREYWEGLYLKALEELVATHAERKEFEQAIAYAKRSLTKNPLQEGLHRQLMYLYYAAGDRDGALRQYLECRNVLKQELDVEPVPETKALYQEIERRTGAAQLEEIARRAGTLIAKYPELGAPFVGRSGECERLIAAWRKALQGSGSGVLVVGEAGAGKTRLGQEIAEYVKTHSNPSGLVLAGRCYEIEGRLPYQPWVEALRQAIASVPPSVLSAVSLLWLGEVVKLVPELAERVPNVRPTPPLHAPEQERNRLFEGLTQFLLKLSQAQPLFLFLDDLQWADDSSLQYMHYLLRRLREARIVLLGAYRVEEVDEDHPLWALLQYGLKEGVLTTLELAPLSEEEIRELIAGTLQTKETPPGLAEYLDEKSQGNPFFAVELLKSLIESGALSPSPGREEHGNGAGNGNGNGKQEIVWQWEPGRLAERELPPTVRAVVQTRVLRLSPMSRELLQLISTRTRPVDTRFLAQATRRREEEISPLVDELVRTQFLHPEERAYTVQHDLIREVIYRGLPPERRRQLHLRVGKALEEIRTRRRDGNGHELIGEIAEHFYEAGERVRALHYALQAGQRAWERSYAKEEALRFFRRAEELAEQLGDRERLAQAYKGLGEIHCFTDRPEKGLRYCEQALALLEDLEEVLHWLQRARPHLEERHIKLLASYPSINPTVDRFRESPEFQALQKATSGLGSD